jgi:hypothetical protein
MKGITTRDIEHYNPRCNARGTIKAGTEVVLIKKEGWSGWVVKHRGDAGFMSKFDWDHSYVDVPADAVKGLL